MRLEDVHLHDATILRVVERPDLDLVAFELDYPEDWEANLFVPKTLVFREVLRVRTDKLNENSDDDFEPRTELNQPAGGLPLLIAA